MIVWYVECFPVAKVTGAPQVLRYCTSPQAARAEGKSWLPRLRSPLRRSVQVFDGTFQDQPQDYGSVEVAISSGDLVSPVAAMAWDGRRVRVLRGPPGQQSGLEVVFDGEASTVEATKKGFQVNLRGPGYAMSKDLMTRSYDGSGGAGGTPDLANNLLPLLIGQATNVTPTYVNRARGIFQYHGYGAGHVLGVYDGGSPLSWTGRDWPGYAGLDGDDPGTGFYSTCDALGMARHGGTPIDVLGVDCSGTAGTIGGILTFLAGQVGVPVDSPTMSWLDANLPHPQDNYLTDQTSADAVARDMMLKLGGYLTYSPSGLLSAGLVRRGPAEQFHLGRGSIKTLSVRATQPPYHRRRMGYQRSWRVQTFAETRTPAVVNPRGAYAAGTTYSYYDLVSYGSYTWLHLGLTATTGVAPVDGETWTRFQATATKTSELTDDAGLGLTATWPQVSNPTGGKPEDYADITAHNTAARIINQGDLALMSTVGWDTSQLSGRPYYTYQTGSVGGNIVLSGTGVGYTPTGQLLSSVFPSQFGADQTSQNTANRVLGQGTFATQSHLDLGDQAFFGATGRFQALDNGDGNFFRASATVFGTNSTGYRFLVQLEPGEYGANVTEGRTSRYVYQQGDLATRSTVGTQQIDPGSVISVTPIYVGSFSVGGSPAEYDYSQKPPVLVDPGSPGDGRVFTQAVFVPVDGCNIIVLGTVKQDFPSGAHPWQFRTIVDGQQKQRIWGGAIQDGVPIEAYQGADAGQHTVELQYDGQQTLYDGYFTIIVAKR